VKEHPILFSTAMVQAILADKKTQTRRVLKPQPPLYGEDVHLIPCGMPGRISLSNGTRACLRNLPVACPYGTIGDRLWVRETFAYLTDYDGQYLLGEERKAFYKADGERYQPQLSRWRPSIHMPRRLSRITLRIVSNRIERIQDITKLDAKLEGCASREDFRALWDALNAKRGFGWDKNPWVWVIGFRRI
jgi:hypothetical protein